MQLTPFGAARMTTGSRHLLEIGGKKILLDCGLREGKRDVAREKNAHFPFDPATLDAVILSHAHIDHSGNLPNLVKQGFKGNIYATPATRDLCSIMLQDSAKIQESDAAFVNKRRARQGLPPVVPIYTIREAEKTLRQFVTLDYYRSFPVADGVSATFLDAGHMLGSAQVVLDLRENGRSVRLLFSGDVGRGHDSLLRDPDHAKDIDVVLMESTYGSRLHEERQTANDDLCRIINEAVARGGKIVIPSFAVGRVQQVVFALHQLREVNCFPKIPIFVDSPLSVNATEIFRLHPECFNKALQDFLFEKRNPFGWDDITYIRELSQSKALNDLPGPAIIISASGMCEAGRILHHLRNTISDERNTVLFVGYCAENTLGHQILRGDPTVKIFGEPFEVKAKIAKIDAYSGHADRNELLAFAANTGGARKKFILVHGEAESGLALQAALREAHPSSDVLVPAEGEAIPF